MWPHCPDTLIFLIFYEKKEKQRSVFTVNRDRPVTQALLLVGLVIPNHPLKHQAASVRHPTHMLTPCDRALKAGDSASAAAAAASLSLIPDQNLRTQTGRTGRCRWRTLRKERKTHKVIRRGPRRSVAVAVGPNHLCHRMRTAWTDTPPCPGLAASERRWRWRGSTGSGRSASDLFSGSGKNGGSFQN